MSRPSIETEYGVGQHREGVEKHFDRWWIVWRDSKRRITSVSKQDWPTKKAAEKVMYDYRDYGP